MFHIHFTEWAPALELLPGRSGRTRRIPTGTIHVQPGGFPDIANSCREVCSHSYPDKAVDRSIRRRCCRNDGFLVSAYSMVFWRSVLSILPNLPGACAIRCASLRSGHACSEDLTISQGCGVVWSCLDSFLVCVFLDSSMHDVRQGHNSPYSSFFDSLLDGRRFSRARQATPTAPLLQIDRLEYSNVSYSCCCTGDNHHFVACSVPAILGP